MGIHEAWAGRSMQGLARAAKANIAALNLSAKRRGCAYAVAHWHSCISRRMRYRFSPDVSVENASFIHHASPAPARLDCPAASKVHVLSWGWVMKPLVTANCAIQPGIKQYSQESGSTVSGQAIQFTNRIRGYYDCAVFLALIS